VLFGREHVDRYVETNGEEGYDWARGSVVLILTTKGRRTSLLRSAALIFGRRGDDYLVVGSKGGAPQPPAWYLNLQADPEVQVQVKADRFSARARTATPDEKPVLWQTMTSIWPDYDAYQQRCEREIPVVILERRPGDDGG
jgi:deazaflavin-dependent oxidoreductase (nitroreductase family)